MLIVILMAVGLWLLGRFMGTPVQARLIMIALLYVAVLFLQFALAPGHPLREQLGGGPAPWLILGAVGLAVLAYWRLLGRVRGRAATLEAARDAGDGRAAQDGPFSDVELERYARHITLREIGGLGQRRLKEARVLVVGAGGLGSPVLLYLAAAGVGTLGVVDDDAVDLSNLQRQVIHTDARGGMPKVFSAQAAVAALNPHVAVRPYHRRLTEDIAEAMVADYDLIVDGSDSFDTRDVVNRAAVASGRPVIGGAITQWEGQVTVYDPAGGAPCMACLFPRAPRPGQAPTCAEAGVVGALPGLIGSLMALEAIKEITGAGTPLRGRLLIWDALDAETRTVRVKRRADCAVCGDI
ncbi:molybdopterin-synthase adenylyltransferase MoeB [Jannaschia sp. LMIT008]|uniref:HesA/MoeB/ThiF family protein n=1 Tax=Jannaschia maritima TaxID=3032585 RepID=UPI0028117119|nr:molybdopterin-synthase adenylyltransferase MoeB [Jannaschia sp. LMIT008]